MSDEEPIGFVATDADAGRLDVAIARRFPGAGRRRLAVLFERGAVRVDGKRARKGDRLVAGARVELAEVPARGDDLRARPDADAAARLRVLWRGADALAITKPAGMPSQPLGPEERGTAANGIVHLEPACATASDDPRDGGLVHRLDGGTSGVLVAATTPDAWRRLRAAFSAGRTVKRYLAVTTARPARLQTQAALAQRGKRVVVDEVDGLPAATDFRIVASSADGAHHLIECTARSGRMHQVRAHLAHVGAPILGDTLYGGAPHPAGFFLHAGSIQIPDELDVTAPLPPERTAVLAELGLPVP